MYEIISFAIKNNDPSYIKKIIEKINKNYECINEEGNVYIGYLEEYVVFYETLLKPIGYNDLIKEIENRIKNNNINETLIYFCIYFNVCIEQLLNCERLFWLSDEFINIIINNNKSSNNIKLLINTKMQNYYKN
jgi:hypothetical protein